MDQATIFLNRLSAASLSAARRAFSNPEPLKLHQVLPDVIDVPLQAVPNTLVVPEFLQRLNIRLCNKVQA